MEMDGAGDGMPNMKLESCFTAQDLANVESLLVSGAPEEGCKVANTKFQADLAQRSPCLASAYNFAISMQTDAVNADGAFRADMTLAQRVTNRTAQDVTWAVGTPPGAIASRGVFAGVEKGLGQINGLMMTRVTDLRGQTKSLTVGIAASQQPARQTSRSLSRRSHQATAGRLTLRTAGAPRRSATRSSAANPPPAAKCSSSKAFTSPDNSSPPWRRTCSASTRRIA